MDYKDTTVIRTLRAYLVPPTDLDDVYEEMTGVDWSSLAITAGYYTDTRVTASLRVVDSNYIKGSYIRITEQAEGDDEREIGTFAVHSDTAKDVNGAHEQTLTLISQLHALSLDACPDLLTVGKGARIKTVVETTLKDGGKNEKDYITTDANDYIFGNTQMLEAGATRLSRLYELAGLSNNRLDVDAHGRITLTKYQTPDSRTPSLRLSQMDERGVILDGMTRESNWAEVPTRVIVAHDYTEGTGDNAKQHHMFAIANNGKAPARGYVVSEYETLTELSPRTQNNLQAIARQRLAEKANDKNEWSFACKYIPGLWEGDVVELETKDSFGEFSGVRKCLVKNIDINGQYLDMDITLKETSGGDDGE